MKPFNLTDFKAGKKVVTRDGREVKQLTVFECHSEWPIGGVVSGELMVWTKSGKEWISSDSKNDLFHPDEEMYVYVWEDSTGEMVCSRIYNKPNSELKTYKLVKVD